MNQFKIVLIIILLPQLAQLSAFIFEPATMFYRASGEKSAQYLHIDNITNSTIRLKVSVYRLSLNKMGDEILSDALQDFFIYPSELILKPGIKKNIRLQYTGSDLIIKEKIYRVIVDQIPLDIADNDYKESIILSYKGTIYVEPEKIIKDIRVKTITKADNRMVITLINCGTIHTVLKESILTIHSIKGSLIVDISEIEDLYNSNILPGGIREFEIPWPKNMTDGELKGYLVPIEPN